MDYNYDKPYRWSFLWRRNIARSFTVVGSRIIACIFCGAAKTLMWCDYDFRIIPEHDSYSCSVSPILFHLWGIDKVRYY